MFDVYNNAISDHLVIVCHEFSYSFFIFDKNKSLKWHKKITSDHVLAFFAESELSQHIFSTKHAIAPVGLVTLLPKELDKASRDSVISLHFDNTHEACVLSGSQLFDFAIDFPLAQNPITQGIPSISWYTPSQLFYNFCQGHLHTVPHRLFFWYQENFTHIAVWKNGSFVFLNVFKTNNREDVFYYIMAVVEQTNLEVSSLHVTQLASSIDFHMQEFLKNYIVHFEHFNFEDSLDLGGLSQEMPMWYFKQLPL